MIVKEEFLSRLRKIFDLNLYEVKVWTALLSRGTSTAGELSSISDVPRSRTYDILESLEKKGFIVMKLGKPIKFIALKPEEVIERVKKNLVVNAREKSKRLEKLKSDEVLEELTGIFSEGIRYVEPTDLSGSLKGRQNVYNHLDMLVREAEKTITSFDTASDDLVTLFRNKMKIDVDKLKSDELRSAITISEMLSEGLVAIKMLREKRQIIRFKKFNSTTGSAYTADEKRAEIDKLQRKENQLAHNLMRDLKESADPYLFMSTFGNRTFKTYANKNIKSKGWQKVVAGYFK